MKILPKWYTFQVETGPFFNYYIQLKGEEYLIKKDSLVDLKRGNEPKENKQILERIVKLCEEREMKVRLV